MFAVLVRVVIVVAAAPTVAFIINFMQQLFQLASFAYECPPTLSQQKWFGSQTGSHFSLAHFPNAHAAPLHPLHSPLQLHLLTASLLSLSLSPLAVQFPHAV